MKLQVADLNSFYGPAHILFDIALEVGEAEQLHRLVDDVAQRRAEKIGHPPARFFENNLRRARIPKFCARTEMNV